VNRAELVDAIANAAALGKREVDQVVGELVGQITRALQAGQKVNLPGIGAFSTAPSKPRVGRNPRTGIEVPIPAGVRVRFHASSTLKSAVGKKKAAKKSTSKAGTRSSPARKTTAKSPATKKPATRKNATKKTATKSNATKPTATKANAAKKTTKQTAAKKTTKAAAKTRSRR